MPSIVKQRTIKTWMRPEEIELHKISRGLVSKAIADGLIPGKNPRIEGLFDEGESSDVYLVSTDSQKWVVKMSPNEDALRTEAYCFSKWDQLGVNVPDTKLIEQQTQGARPMLLMEYVSHPLLQEAVPHAEDRIRLSIPVKMGETLAQMHGLSAEGFGHPVIRADKVVGAYETVEAYTLERLLGERTQKLLSDGVINDSDFRSAHQAEDYLIETQDQSPVMLHNDFLPYNLFYDAKSAEIIVFDPNTVAGPPELDLALTVLKTRIGDTEYGEREANEIISGYERERKVDRKRLGAAIILRAMPQLHTSSMKKRKHKIERILEVVRNAAASFG